MKESDTYQYILEEGATGEARKLVILLGEEHLGSPDKTTLAALEGIADLERLERMARRASRASTWQEVLDTP
jgi:hypothetical protein